MPGYPANLGIGRPALHKVLGDRAIAAGATVRLGVTVTALVDDGSGVMVSFSDGTEGRYDLVIGADGVYSATRRRCCSPMRPSLSSPARRCGATTCRARPDLDALQAYNGPTGVGLVPHQRDADVHVRDHAGAGQSALSASRGWPRPCAARWRTCAPAIRALAEQITDDEAWSIARWSGCCSRARGTSGRVVLLGDAVHATTPHLGQGAGMAIEDGSCWPRNLPRHDDAEAAFAAFRAAPLRALPLHRRAVLAICRGQLGKGPPVDNAKATARNVRDGLAADLNRIG